MSWPKPPVVHNVPEMGETIQQWTTKRAVGNDDKIIKKWRYQQQSAIRS